MKKNALHLFLTLTFCLGLLSGCGGQENQTPDTSSQGPASQGQDVQSTGSPSQGQDVTPAGSPSQAQDEQPAQTPEESTQEPSPAANGSWQDVLLAMGYCGNVENCTMTADQALTYAQLLADGIAGNAPMGAGADLVAADKIYWDTPYTVSGYSGDYQTDRAQVILGDFAGDSTPYLCVLSSLAEQGSFDVYYIETDEAEHIFGAETYGSRAAITFQIGESGGMTIMAEGPSDADSYLAARYILFGGKPMQQYSRIEQLNTSENMMHVTINGVESVFTPEEWEIAAVEEAKNAGPQEPAVEYTSIPLRTMINYLNQYAAAKGSTKSVAVPG